MSRPYILGLDLGTTTGVCRLFDDGSIECERVTHKSDLQARCCGVARIIMKHMTAPGCRGVSVEEPFSGQFSSVKALFPMIGAVVLQCEELEVPWCFTNVSTLKLHATGKGNAKKPDMQAAAKERWGVELGEDEADAAWAAAYAFDHKLFNQEEA